MRLTRMLLACAVAAFAVSARAAESPDEASLAGVSIVWALAADPFSPDAVYAATDVGLFRSLDGGVHWAATLLNLSTQAVAADPSHPGTVYAASGPAFYRSLDGGTSWTRVGGGLSAVVRVTSLAFDHAHDVVYAGISTENIFAPPPPGPAFGVFRSADRGATFQPTGLTAFAVGAIAVDPTNPSVLYAAPFAVPVLSANNGKGVWKSADGGATWTVSLDLAGPAIRSIAVDPTSGANVYASWFIGIVFASADAGATWNRIEIGQDAVGDSRGLVVDASGALYLATNRGVFRSANAGQYWSPVLGTPVTAIYSLLVDRGRLFAGVGPGPAGTPSTAFAIYRTADGGATWTGASPGGGGGCSPGPQNLCLNGGRFDVRVRWASPPAYPEQTAAAAPLFSQTGAFWFFEFENLELVVKVLDGRSINGRFWVFSGALSNVQYTITVSDTVTGAIRTYFNPAGRLASLADTSAFP